MNMLFRSSFISLSIKYICFFSLVLLAACSYKTPPSSTPAPTDQQMAKSFVVNPDNTAKTFACSWAPISEIGFIAEATQIHHAATMPACNIQFSVEKDLLVGKQINPSLAPKDWATVITIPIQEHSTYEPVKDKYGRATKDFANNSQQHNWNARPNMTLNFSGLQVLDRDYEFLYGGSQIESVTDVEQSTHEGKSYLAFTLAVSSPIWGRHNQAKIRVNFLEFNPESTRSFLPRLYHEDNSVHLGAIWGLGKKIEGVNPVKYLARWDLRPQSIPHKICLNGFEEDKRARELAVETLEAWNTALVEAKILEPGQKAFVPSDKTTPYGFDLRCSSITYVADKRISENSPLGIAQVQADVNNGKILWSAMTVYGGAIESYIEHYRGSARGKIGGSGGGVFSEKLGQVVYGGNPFTLVNMPMPGLLNPSATRSSRIDRLRELEQITQSARADSLNKFLAGLREEGVNINPIQQSLANGKAKELFSADRSELAKNTQLKPDELERVLGDIQKRLTLLQNKNADAMNASQSLLAEAIGTATDLGMAQYTNAKKKIEAVDSTRLLLGQEVARSEAVVSQALFGDNWKNLSRENKEAILLNRKRGAQALHSRHIHDIDRSIGESLGQLAELPADLQGRSSQDIVEYVVKETMLHEFGHMIGFAHNFKENIMPREGSVPKKYFNELAADRDKPYHQNSSTVMGYPHPFQMLGGKTEELKVGMQDLLVLRYIYRNEYSTWNGKDEDFSFREVPADGRIPSGKANLGENHRVTYFPSCTDYIEILGLDPYCNKWDRGFDAKTIVQGYLDDFENNWTKKFSNIVDTGADPFFVNYQLWVRSLNTASRVRKFYDHMRYNFRKEIQTIANADKSNLFQFSKCNSDQQNNTFLKQVFASASPEFAELCEANKIAVERLSTYLKDKGPDFTTYDNNNFSTPVGEVGNEGYQSDAKIFGTWKELGVLPMKLSATYALTTAVPFWTYGPYAIPVYKYAREGENTKFTYASLYPYEFTQGIAEGLMANLKFNAIDDVNPQMGRLALFMGSFLAETFRYFESTNDYHIFDKGYMNTIRGQSEFIFDPSEAFVPILIQAVSSKEAGEDPDRRKAFNASVYVWGQRPIQLGDAYILPEGKVFLRSSPQTFIYPVSELFFLDDSLALVWGIRLQYSLDRYSNLGVYGMKQQLHNQYQRVIDSCIDGAKLKDYFNKTNKDFRGFKIIPGIAGSENRYQSFTDSVKEEFEKYWKNPNFGANDPKQRDVCIKAVDDVGLTVSQALALGNIWMPQITEYMVK